MKTLTATLPRFANGGPSRLHGWAGRLLRVDLSDGRIWAQETAHMFPDLLGGRGVAAKILWDEYPEPVDAFDPRNPFMVMPGALTGARSPYSGRTVTATFSPQAYPYTWFTRANIGGYFGDELKKAGYDGLVVTGASDKPVRILIEDDKVSVLPAGEMWGLDTIETQEAVEASLGGAAGKKVKTMAIGVAGERLSRIATVQTGTTNVAGQGGFGAVWGSKKLKAISVIGTGTVSLADPERLSWLYRAVGAEVGSLRNRRGRLDKMNEQLAQEGGGKVRLTPCTANCPTPCRLGGENIQGCAFDRKWSGDMACVSGIFGGMGRNALYDWNFGFRGGFELNMYANRLGLNHWELLIGVIPWLRTCQREGRPYDLDGMAADWHSPQFFVEMLRKTAEREGMGDALAEGGIRAAQMLNLGEDIVQRYYTGWGFSGHWDGHACFANHIVYPFWIASAIHWAMDTRDPASSTHCYIQNVMYWSPFGGFYKKEDAPITWEHMKGIGEKMYGRADTLDPVSGYDGKEVPSAYHAKRSVMKDCLPTDDQVFTLIYSHNTPDRFFHIGQPSDPWGVIEGPDVDAHLLNAGTGTDWDTAEFMRAAERVLNLERANQVRHWGRDRKMDERVLPSFAYDENWVNPEIGERKALDLIKFAPVMDKYLQLLGWDVQTGWPTAERLSSLGLGDIYKEMVAGAERAKATLEPLPAVEPVIDYHRYDPDREDRQEQAAS
jgi:aldehyde:ferredoxin oxidoreductase